MPSDTRVSLTSSCHGHAAQSWILDRARQSVSPPSGSPSGAALALDGNPSTGMIIDTIRLGHPVVSSANPLQAHSPGTTRGRQRQSTRPETGLFRALKTKTALYQTRSRMCGYHPRLCLCSTGGSATIAATRDRAHLKSIRLEGAPRFSHLSSRCRSELPTTEENPCLLHPNPNIPYQLETTTPTATYSPAATHAHYLAPCVRQGWARVSPNDILPQVAVCAVLAVLSDVRTTTRRSSLGMPMAPKSSHW